MTEKPEDGSDFIVTGDKDKLQPKEAEEEKKEEVQADSHNVAGFECLNCVMSRPRIPMVTTRRRLSMCKMTTLWRQVYCQHVFIFSISNIQKKTKRYSWVFLCRLCRIPTVLETTRGREGRMEVNPLPRKPGLGPSFASLVSL